MNPRYIPLVAFAVMFCFGVGLAVAGIAWLGWYFIGVSVGTATWEYLCPPDEPPNRGSQS